jgi:hypothetical protein
MWVQICSILTKQRCSACGEILNPNPYQRNDVHVCKKAPLTSLSEENQRLAGVLETIAAGFRDPDSLSKIRDFVDYLEKSDDDEEEPEPEGEPKSVYQPETLIELADRAVKKASSTGREVSVKLDLVDRDLSLISTYVQLVNGFSEIRDTPDGKRIFVLPPKIT